MPTTAQIAEAMFTLSNKGYKVKSIKEEYIAPTQSGNSPGVTPGDPQSDYAKRVFKMPSPTEPDMYPSALSDLQDAHDRLAFVTGLECGPLTMEARKRWGNDIVREAKALQDGSNISDGSMQHLLKTHDSIANCCGMSCIGAATANSPQEAMQRTYKQFQENMRKQQELHEQRMAELKQLAQKRNYPTRANIQESVLQTCVTEGAALLDRSRPLPFDAEQALGVLQHEYLALHTAKYPLG